MGRYHQRPSSWGECGAGQAQRLIPTGLPVTQLCRPQMGRPWVRLMASLSLSFHTWVMWVGLEGAGQELAWPGLALKIKIKVKALL